jgi:thymidylate synthase
MKNNIKAEIITHSKRENTGEEIITYKLTFPRIILSEVNTYKMMEKNTSSCLLGNTLITFDQPTKQGNNKFCSVKVPIKEFCEKWNNGNKLRKRNPNKVANFEDKNYTAKEIAMEVKTSPSNIRKLCREGKIKVENPNKKRVEDFIVNGLIYNEYHNGYETKHKPHKLMNMSVRVLNEDTLEFENAKVSQVFICGEKDVYEIELENGYKLTCTDSHRIFTNEGWKTLKGINVKLYKGQTIWNDHTFKVATNGFEVTKDWLLEQKSLGKSLKQVCEEYNLNFKSVSNKSEEFGIRWRKPALNNETFEYKDKEWLESKINEGLFCPQIAEICNTSVYKIRHQLKKFKIRGNHKVGFLNEKGEVWNKGLKGYKHTKEAVENMRIAAQKRRKPDSYKSYEVDKTKRIRFMYEMMNKFISEDKYVCCITGLRTKLRLHHIDPVWHNKEREYDETNLIPIVDWLHKELHKRHLDLEFLKWYEEGRDLTTFFDAYEDMKIHIDEIKKPKPGVIHNGKLYHGNPLFCQFFKIKSITYKGKQETYDIEIEGKFHNFVANGFVVHNSRAIPFEKMVEVVEKEPFIPIAWQLQHKGMQGDKYLTDPEHIKEKNEIWLAARDMSVDISKELIGNINKIIYDEDNVVNSVEIPNTSLSKNYSNRLLEPFMWTTQLVTGTRESFKHLFEQRCPQYEIDGNAFGKLYYKSKKSAIECCDMNGISNYPDIDDDLAWLKINKGQAEIHFMDLAEKMYDALNESKPDILKEGEWHIPFQEEIWKSKQDEKLEDFIKISVCLTAKVSYTKIGDDNSITIEKAREMYERLKNLGHWSCFGHIAKCMTNEDYDTWIKGRIHEDSSDYRIIIPEETKGYNKQLRGFISLRQYVEDGVELKDI